MSKHFHYYQHLGFSIYTFAKYYTIVILFWPVTVCLQDIMAEGHSAHQVITQMHDLLLLLEDLTDEQKSAIFERLAVSFIKYSISSLLVCRDG